MHPRSDAGRYPRLRGARGKRQRTPFVPLSTRPGVLPAVDGRRDQSRQPADPVRAAAGDAGRKGVDRRAVSPVAAPVSCVGDAEPVGAGGHLSAARGAARPLSAADRCRLPRSGVGASRADRHHRHRRRGAAPGDDLGRADRGAASRAPGPGRRERGRRNSQAGAVRPSRRPAPTERGALSPGAPARAPVRR